MRRQNQVRPLHMEIKEDSIKCRQREATGERNRPPGKGLKNIQVCSQRRKVEEKCHMLGSSFSLKECKGADGYWQPKSRGKVL